VKANLRRTALVAALCAVFVTAIAAARPNVVERWGIYASSTAGPPDSFPLFLEPFPTKFSCDVEARIIVQNGGHAVCRSRLKLEMGSAEQDRLWAQFWPSARWIAFCQGQLRRHDSRERQLTSSAQRPAIVGPRN
jgi:hypothetical protein